MTRDGFVVTITGVNTPTRLAALMRLMDLTERLADELATMPDHDTVDDYADVRDVEDADPEYRIVHRRDVGQS